MNQGLIATLSHQKNSIWLKKYKTYKMMIQESPKKAFNTNQSFLVFLINDKFKEIFTKEKTSRLILKLFLTVCPFLCNHKLPPTLKREAEKRYLITRLTH
jgi:hypothetical protein